MGAILCPLKNQKHLNSSLIIISTAKRRVSSILVGSLIAPPKIVVVNNPMPIELDNFSDLIKDHNFYYFLRGYLIHDYSHQLKNIVNSSGVQNKDQPRGNTNCFQKDAPSKSLSLSVSDVDDVSSFEDNCSSGEHPSNSTVTPTFELSLNKTTFAFDPGTPTARNVEPHVLALRFLNFYSDSSEFMMLPRSKFKALRAEKIVDQYIRFGAPSKLPFAYCLLEEIRKKFDARPDDPPPDTFSAARTEAVEYLEAEVWPVLQESGQLRRWVEKIHSVPASPLYMRSQLSGFRDLNFEMSSMPLQDALRDTVECNAFKRFIQLRPAPAAESSLLFYLEVVDFDAMNAALQKSTDVQNSRKQYLLMWADKIYDKYLKLGARQEVTISKQVREEVQKKLANEDCWEAFALAKEIAFRLLYDLFNEFRGSELYLAVVQMQKDKARRKKSSLKKAILKLKTLKMISANLVVPTTPGSPGSPKTSVSRKSNRKNVVFGREPTPVGGLEISVRRIKLKNDNDAEMSAFYDDDSVSCRRSTGNQRASEGSIMEMSGEFSISRSPELKQKLTAACSQYFNAVKNGNKLHFFQRHLETLQMHHYLLFFSDVEEFETIPLAKGAYMKGQALKIYDKYLRLSGLHDIYIDEQIRSNILSKLPDPDWGIFVEAKQAVYDTLLDEWPLFMQSEMYKQLIDSGGLDAANISQNSMHLAPELDIPLFVLLEDQMMAHFFKEFCDQEFYPQTVRFWMDVEEFKRTPSGAFLETRCNKLMHMYIQEGALCALPISEDTRELIEKNQETPGPNLFEPAQTEVYDFMVTQLYRRFQKTDAYHQNLDHLKHLHKMHVALANKINKQTDSESISVQNLQGARVHDGAISEEDSMKALKQVLKSQSGVRFLKEFCEQIYCTENIFFWMEAEDFLNIPGGQRYLESFARKIIHKFVIEGARMQINIPGKMAAEIVAHIDSPSREMFVPAQREVLDMMLQDTWPKFRASKHYQEYLHYQRTRRCSAQFST